MNEKITHTSLVEFIAEKSEIDFAKYMYVCGATKFINKTEDFDQKSYEPITNYHFDEYYITPEHLCIHPYYVLSIQNKSYIMYEKSSEITIWVCYTEEAFRCKGYIVKLLEWLKNRYPEKTITIDTFKKSLQQSCLDLGISLFKR